MLQSNEKVIQSIYKATHAINTPKIQKLKNNDNDEGTTITKKIISGRIDKRNQ